MAKQLENISEEMMEQRNKNIDRVGEADMIDGLISLLVYFKGEDNTMAMLRITTDELDMDECNDLLSNM